MSDEITVGLCGPGRHDIEGVEKYIYEGQVDAPLDFKTHGQTAFTFLTDCVENDIHQVNLYVTGLTPVLTAFLKVWVQTNCVVGLTLYHYNRETNSYIAQEM
jgi:hypothetical protein